MKEIIVDDTCLVEELLEVTQAEPECHISSRDFTLHIKFRKATGINKTLGFFHFGNYDLLLEGVGTEHTVKFAITRKNWNFIQE